MHTKSLSIILLSDFIKFTTIIEIKYIFYGIKITDITHANDTFVTFQIKKKSINISQALLTIHS